MKKNVVFGIIAGFAAGVAATVAGTVVVDKIAKEIKSDLSEQKFTSPNGDNTVTLSYGSSKTAKGLAYIKLQATARSKQDTCKLVAFAKKNVAFLSGEWIDNDHFKLLIGSGKRKQCCDVSFDTDKIVAHYYLMKKS